MDSLFIGYDKVVTDEAELNGLPMKWYRALVTWLLYVAAALDVLAAIGYFGGGLNTYLYAQFPATRVVDILYGVCSLGIAFGCLYSRSLLAQYKSHGPKIFMMLLLINIGTSLVYTVVIGLISGQALIMGAISGAIISLVIFFLNKTYFDKRIHLFTVM